MSEDTFGRAHIGNGDIENRFTYHPPKEGQPKKYTDIRARAKFLAYLISEDCPNGREKALALTKLEEAVMWANAAIARGTIEDHSGCGDEAVSG